MFDLSMGTKVSESDAVGFRVIQEADRKRCVVITYGKSQTILRTI